jgi:hypothetical protein
MMELSRKRFFQILPAPSWRARRRRLAPPGLLEAVTILGPADIQRSPSGLVGASAALELSLIGRCLVRVKARSMLCGISADL